MAAEYGKCSGYCFLAYLGFDCTQCKPNEVGPDGEDLGADTPSPENGTSASLGRDAIAPPPGTSAGTAEGAAPPAAMPTAPPPREEMAHSSQMKEDTVREALLSMVAEHCCYGKSAAKTMTLDKYTPHVAHHYILETFTESRHVYFAHRPHRGGNVDGPNCGTSPKPWAMKNCRIPEHWEEHEEHIQVPHTEVAKTCYNCNGSGDVRCDTCSGKGDIRCGSCNGQGTTRQREGDHWKDVKCSICMGKGYNRCTRCMGKGFITCPECCGAKMLCHFERLSINWHTFTDDVVQQVTTLPDHLVKRVSGDIVFQEEDAGIFPVNHCPEETINVSSKQLLEKHKTCLKTHRQQRQRHKLRVVPNTEVDAEFKKKKYTFYIYGLENKVHFPTYPQKCCWGCTIM